MKRFFNLKFNSIAALSLSAVLGIGAAGVTAQTAATDESQTTAVKERRGDRRGGGKFRKNRRGRGGKMGARMFRGLNLTEEQKTRIKQIRAAFRETNKPLRDELKAKRSELRQARTGETFDEALAAQKLKEMADLRAKLMGESFRMRRETLSVLTAEQKNRLDELRAERETKRAERRARRASKKTTPETLNE
jgi:protein CpxP